VYVVARSFLTAGLDAGVAARRSAWVPVGALGVVGATLVVIGLPALYPELEESASWPALVGVALTTVGYLFSGFFLSLFGLLVQPWLAERAPSLIGVGATTPASFLGAFIIGLGAQVIGAVLFAMPFVRGRRRPQWVGYVLIASALMAIVGDVIAPNGPASNLGINLLSNAGPLLLMIALGYLGGRMWTAPLPR
jgi:hypothetical protein